MNENCYLILEDKTIYPGISFGKEPPHAKELTTDDLKVNPAGEVVFNTGMSGYHEILTDPSYRGQIVTMTYPHIGNYGCSDDWSESGPGDYPGKLEVNVSGFVIRQLYDGPIPMGRKSLDQYLKEHNICGISNVDTRKLTLRIRDKGMPRGVIIQPEGAVLSREELEATVAFLKEFPEMEGRDLVSDLGVKEMTKFHDNTGPHFCIIDSGVKTNIFRDLIDLGCKVTVAPNRSTIDDISALKPDGVLFSNGPGDPAVLPGLVKLAGGLIGRIPLCGICLGHQIISQALGAKTFKMKFGHHGINNPVKDEDTGMVIVTSQNHGFAVDDSTLPKDVEVRFRNANDKTVEGIVHRKLPLYTVQFHPESAPGPRDSRWIFEDFINLIGK